MGYFIQNRFFLQKVYYELGLDRICRTVCKSHKNEYNLNEILSRLLYTRVLYPGSKLSSLEDSKRFIEQSGTELHQIYRALSLLAKESDAIQAAVYKNSLKLGRRNTQVLYYDCTNYFFESEEEGGLKQYGCSKENRPNPIVQMGMFMDMEGIPLAFCINPGNTNEQVTLKPLEQKLNDSFGYYINIWRKKLNRGLNHFTPEEIIGTLTDMNFLSIAAERADIYKKRSHERLTGYRVSLH